MYSRRNNEDGLTCYKGVYIDLYDSLQYGTGRSFIQNRTPHGLGLVWTGKVGRPHSHKNQKQWDHEGYEANATTMFFKHTHGISVTDSLIQYKPVEFSVSANRRRLRCLQNRIATVCV